MGCGPLPAHPFSARHRWRPVPHALPRLVSSGSRSHPSVLLARRLAVTRQPVRRDELAPMSITPNAVELAEALVETP